MRCGQIIYLGKSDTGKAILVRQGNGEPVWIPTGQISGSLLDKSDRPEHSKVAGHIEIPGWLAEKKGFV